MHRSHSFDYPDIVEYSYDEDKQSVLRDDPSLWWHDNVESLVDSAKAGCPLCVVVSNIIEALMARYEQSKTTAYYKEFLDNFQEDLANEPLRLTRRSSDADGLMVFIAHTRYNRCGRRDHRSVLACSLAFSVVSNDPLSFDFTLRPPSLNSGSRASLNLVSGWVNCCAESHDDCSGAETPLPTRLLDVGRTAEDLIKLVEPEAGTIGKFASLSYCWGSSLTVSTTQSQTFQDAIRITRHIGLRYLWIDSLCILQDDEDDWARESARMSDTFSRPMNPISMTSTPQKTSNKDCKYSSPLV